MRKFVSLFLLTFLIGQFSFSQCEFCHPPKGRTIDYCYQDQSLKGFCAMFKEGQRSFYLENENRKKNQVMEVYLPKDMKEGATIKYLTDLEMNKKLKLTTEELLFVYHAVQNWREVEALKNWDLDRMAAGYTIKKSGMAYKVIRMGTGEIPTQGKTAVVHYTGYLLDGKKFDSSRDRKAPFEFSLGRGQVIKGWDEGVAMMPIGSRFIFRLPPELAYGSREIPNVIPANSTLIFDVELISVK